ncbi:proline iminopeptidase [Deinococcus metalli]|uniref:Proline iminopeptidase n=1 Tax=Deinococcus metalli TaxID=1141878 RepID=A0A7W8KHE8_9DEIO|nr:alpha/beta fold hydrolase [Deinococcus metalli]MBB5377228.1 proline iminopeptidase [Deinococcus metalli]GHF48028.1 proline iminopeptidase [Deinococcus metalli]
MTHSDFRTLDIGDTRLHARVVGDGTRPPLIVLHGGPGLDHTEFGTYLDPLADTVQLVILDQRAQGRSDRDAPTDTWTLTQMAADVSRVAAALNAPEYAVFGHSYGAFVALQHAADFPGAAAATIACCGVGSSRWLEDIPARLETFEPLALRERVRASWADEANVRTEADFARLMREQMPWHFGDPLDPRVAEYGAHTDALHPRYAPDVLRRFSVAGYGGIEVEERMGAVTQPLLVLAGRLDRTCPPQAGELVARRAPAGEVHVFEDSGHMPFVEQHGEFLDVVRAFLRRTLA